MYALAQRALALLRAQEEEGVDDAADGRRRLRRGAASAASSPATWTWVLAQLVDLLRQYPGGLTESVLMTEIVQRRMRRQGKPDCGKPSGRGTTGTSSTSGSGAPGIDSGPSAGASPGAGQGPSGRGSALPGGAQQQQPQPATVEGGQALPHAGAAAAGAGAQLPGQVAFSSLQSGSAQQQQQLAAAAAAAAAPAAGSGAGRDPAPLPMPRPVAVVAQVAHVEDLAPPSGSGPPYETVGGSWLVHMEEGEGPQGPHGGTTTTTSSLSVPMLLHSELQRLVVGRHPLVAPGRRVRVGGFPPRLTAGAVGSKSKRLLPARVLVPELPPAMWADGGPQTDGLPFGNVVALSLEQSNDGVMRGVAPGCRSAFNGWVVARVAEVDPKPKGAARQGQQQQRATGVAALDRHMSRMLGLVSATPVAAEPGTTGEGGAAAGQLRAQANLLLWGENMTLADLLLPGDVVGLYSPVVYVHTASEMGVEEGSLHYETGPDTLMVVLQGWGRQQGQQGQGPGAKQQLQATAAEGRSTGCGAGARQDAAGGEAGAGVGRGVPAHVHGGLGAVAAAAGGAGQAGGGQGGTGARTVVVGRVEQILGFTHGVGTKQGGKLRAVLADGNGTAAVELCVAPGSRAMAQVREGHTLVLLGATITHARQQQLGPTQHTSPGAGPTSPQGASAAGPPAVAAAHRMSCTDSASATPQHTPALTTNTTSTATIAWVEADAGSELFSLTAMPGCLTTPPLVSYTSLAAVVLSYSLMPYAGHGAVAHIASAVQPLAGNGGIVSGACHGDGDTWPCRQLQALAAATCQLPDASLGWARDTPFLQRRFGGSTASCGAGAGQQQQNTPGASGIGSQCVQPLGPDSACGSLACVVVVRSADVATHRVHRHCGRPVVRSAMMMEFDDEEEDSGSGAAGGGNATAARPGVGGGGGGLRAADTPSKDQGLDGLWECAFCGLDVVGTDVEWDFRGTLTIADVVDTGAAAAAATGVGGAAGGAVAGRSSNSSLGACSPPQVSPGGSAAGSGGGAGRGACGGGCVLTLQADPAALQGMLGVSAEAFHALPTGRRTRTVQAVLSDRQGRPKRAVAALYPLPPAPHVRGCSITSLGTGDCGIPTAGAGAEAAPGLVGMGGAAGAGTGLAADGGPAAMVVDGGAGAGAGGSGAKTPQEQAERGWAVAQLQWVT